MYTINEVATLTGLTGESIRTYCRKYEHIGSKFGKSWMLNDDDIDSIRERIGKAGKPKGSSNKPRKYWSDEELKLFYHKNSFAFGCFHCF